MVDPLLPISPGGPALPSRRVPAVDRLRKVTREGDRPGREANERREHADDDERADDEPGQDGEGHIDIRV